jgi:hypothetical protein
MDREMCAWMSGWLYGQKADEGVVPLMDGQIGGKIVGQTDLYLVEWIERRRGHV